MHFMQLAISYSVRLLIIGDMINPWHKHFTLQDIFTFLKEMNTHKGDTLQNDCRILTVTTIEKFIPKVNEHYLKNMQMSRSMNKFKP